jgi:pilus assembly protein CpaB
MKKIYILALAAAIIAGSLLYIYLSRLEKAAELKIKTDSVPVITYEDVIIAVNDIEEGTLLTEELLEIKKLPSGCASPNAASQISQAAGMVTASDLAAGEQIILTKLVREEDYPKKLSDMIPKGMYAMSIEVDTEQGAAGFISEGDYVNILSVDEESSQDKTSVTVVEKAEVAKIGDCYFTPDGGAIYSYLTLYLTLDQCRRLNYYDDNTQLRAVLCSGEDSLS